MQTVGALGSYKMLPAMPWRLKQARCWQPLRCPVADPEAASGDWLDKVARRSFCIVVTLANEVWFWSASFSLG